ncbi:hypothetical protein FACS189451_10560 [Bacteroidia bacterium]|nr:hypothetical protein FACS189446_3750 [Bacteroidia bacterium]GHT63622.1 hypothetical protein FACS189451_10560 [Bacteroidia bacterium]
MKKLLAKKSRTLLLFLVVLLFGCEEKDITNILAQQLILSSTGVTLDPGETAQLSAVVSPDNAGNTAVAWISKNTKIATVENGKITAVSPGKTTIAVIAYSDSDVRGEVEVTVTGVPEDLAAAVAGLYIGDVTMGGLPLAADVEATLTAGDNKVYLATNAVTGMGPLSMNIEVDVVRSGDGYIISGTGVSTMGGVKVSGTIDASGNMTLSIELTDAGVTVVYTAKRGKTATDAIAGTYIGKVNSLATGEISEVEVTLTPDGGKVNLATFVEVPGQGTLEMNIPMTVTRNGEDFALSGAGNSTFGPVSISGTVDANGIIDITIILHGFGDLPVSYIGQKKEDLAALVAGTYTGLVAIPGMGEIPGTGVSLTPDGRQVRIATTVETPVGTLTMNIPLDISRDGDGFTVNGSGDSTFGPVSIAGTISATGAIDIIITVHAYGLPVSYTGQRQ